MRILLLFLLLVMITLLIYSPFYWQSRCSNPWTLVKEGCVERVEYLEGGFMTPHQTIIYFDDGSTFTLSHTRNLPSKNIKIYRNGDGWSGHNYKLEAK